MVIDTFLFNGEENLLKFRLLELNDYVDKFVIIECEVDFQNKPKGFFWEKIKHKFNEYEHKIEHIIIESIYEKNKIIDYHESVSLQIHVRQEGVARINKEDDDIIIHSDLDEVWDVNKFLEIKKSVMKNGVVNLEMEWYVWDFEHKIKNILTNHPYVCLGKYLKRNDTYSYRVRNAHFTVKKSAWHLTWFGGIENVIKKAKDGMGSDYYRAKKLNNKMRPISETIDRYKKRRLPLSLSASANKMEIEFVPISKNKRLPKNFRFFENL